MEVHLIHIKNAESGALLYDALNSPVRIQILKILKKSGESNMNQLAKKLEISNGAVTAHVKKLQDAKLLSVHSRSGVRGSQKVCQLTAEKIIIELFGSNDNSKNIYSFDIGVGHYVDHRIYPTCGLATKDAVIGELDDPRYFSYPERINACILWFSSGYVSYQLPNSLKANEICTTLQIEMELASEAPGYISNYPSDIGFRLNGSYLGHFTSPGEFNDRRGLFTPAWWFKNLGQYGKLKVLTVNDSGCFINGMKISEVKLSDLNVSADNDLIFTIESASDAVNKGGINLFGNGFGDYNSGIAVKMFYSS